MWREVFECCDPVEVKYQKPIFKLATEAEKALNYLESMSPLTLAMELLLTALVTTHYMLVKRFGSAVEFPAIKEELDAVRIAITESAIPLLKAEVSSTGTYSRVFI